MSNFTSAEIKYLHSQQLGRLATVSEKGEPHVVPVSFRYNAELDSIDIGGLNLTPSKKYRDAMRHGRVALVIDDVLPPWRPRGIEVRGLAQGVGEGGKEINDSFSPEILRITPTRIVSWGIDSSAYQPSSRKVQ